MATPALPGLVEKFYRLGRLVRKELSESLRDRRTVTTLVLMPLLLYPMLALAFQQLVLSSNVEKQAPLYKVAFASKQEERSLLAYWERGRHHLAVRHAAAPPSGEKIDLADYLLPVPELATLVSPDPGQEVREGRAHVGVRLKPPGGFRADPRMLLFVDVELDYRTGSAAGREAARHLEQLTADANASLVTDGLRLIRVPQRGDPVRIRAHEVPDESGRSTSLIPVLVPLILILMTMAGAVYPAIDLTAGERERGTLEILIAAPIPRIDVLLAKYAAVFTVATLTALVNLGTMALTLQATGIGPALFGSGLNFLVLAQVLALLLLFAAFFSAVLLTLTSFARSFKEAQAYIIPLTLVSMMPGILALTGVTLNGMLSVVPLINIVLLARDLLEGTATPALAAVVVSSTLLYAVAALAVAARVFGTEAVLSSETSGWGDVFRRPPRARATPEPAGALLCLALLFPAYFLASTGLARLSGLDLSGRLAVAAALNVVLFAGFPALTLWMGRVRWSSAFRLHRPGLLACLVALVLGVSAWPLVQELIVQLRGLGLTTLRRDVLDRIRETVAEWRTVHPAVILLAMAAVPAVLEELFFRGYLFGALLGRDEHPGRAVFWSAFAFAVFHLLVGGTVAVERLVPSLLLGLLLGWLAWRSGSVIPGMLLHLAHNGILVLLGLYEPVLVEQGWLAAGAEHLPRWLLAASAGGLAVGLAGLALVRRPPAEAVPPEVDASGGF